MTVWAIADLHLPFGAPSKSMEVFGRAWERYIERMEEAWWDQVGNDDLVLVAGDICWAMRLKDATRDFAWIDTLPGRKVIIRGNHDYWWESLKKVREKLPPSIHAIQNDAYRWGDYSIGGARLWDTQEYGFGEYIVIQPGVDGKLPDPIPSSEEELEKSEQIFQRELLRLEMSLERLDQDAPKRIAMTHYPPIGADLEPSKASGLMEKFNVDICVFGHLHSVPPGTLPFGRAGGIEYRLTSADYLEFIPCKIAD